MSVATLITGIPRNIVEKSMRDPTVDSSLSVLIPCAASLAKTLAKAMQPWTVNRIVGR